MHVMTFPFTTKRIDMPFVSSYSGDMAFTSRRTIELPFVQRIEMTLGIKRPIYMTMPISGLPSVMILRSPDRMMLYVLRHDSAGHITAFSMATIGDLDPYVIGTVDPYTMGDLKADT